MDGLSGTDKLRTELANIVISNTAKIIRWAHERNVACSFENPGNSLFWLVPCIASLIQDIGGYHTSFHKCCHEGLRKKLSLWWSNVDWFLPLTATCQDDHVRKPWKPQKHNGQLHYPTSEEEAYPILLCERVSGIVLDKALLHGATVASDLMQQENTDQSMHRFWLNMLSRGKKYEPLVSEFQHYTNYVHRPQDVHFLTIFSKNCPKGPKWSHGQVG